MMGLVSISSRDRNGLLIALQIGQSIYIAFTGTINVSSFLIYLDFRILAKQLLQKEWLHDNVFGSCKSSKQIGHSNNLLTVALTLSVDSTIFFVDDSFLTHGVSRREL